MRIAWESVFTNTPGEQAGIARSTFLLEIPPQVDDDDDNDDNANWHSVESLLFKYVIKGVLVSCTKSIMYIVVALVSFNHISISV